MEQNINQFEIIIKLVGCVRVNRFKYSQLNECIVINYKAYFLEYALIARFTFILKGLLI